MIKVFVFLCCLGCGSWASSGASIAYEGVRSSSPGKDYQTLRDILQKYPLSYAQSYVNTEKNLEYLGKKSRGRYYKAFSAQQLQKQRLEMILSQFQNDLTQWRLLVQKKLDFGLYGPEKRSFYLKIMGLLKTVVDQQNLANQLAALHQIIGPMKQPDYDGLSFEERFLKPKYAEEYRQRKLNFYTTLILETEKRPLKDPQRISLLKYYKNKRLDWENRPIPGGTNDPHKVSMDELMGISTLRTMGYQGRGVTLGVIEPIDSKSATLGLHEDLARNLQVPDQKLSSHGAHVSGIIAAKARTIRDRLGIAPKATVLFRAMMVSSQGSIIYYENAAKGPGRTIVHSQPSADADQALAMALTDLTNHNVKIINASFVFSLGPQSLKALKQYVEKGGVLIKAAGNSGVALLKKIPVNEKTLSLTDRTQIGIDSGFYNTLRQDPKLMNSILIVGNLKDGQNLEKSSNLAGDLKDRFLGAWGTDVASTTGPYNRERLSGTSMAAPMVTGALALLSEVFPLCATSTLGQILLDSATPIPDSYRHGKGRLDLTAAYTLGQIVCGLPRAPQPKK